MAFTFARRLTFLRCHGDSSFFFFFKLRKITTISGLNLHKLSRKFTVGGLEHIFSIFILFWGGSKELRPQRPVRRTSSGDKTISHPRHWLISVDLLNGEQHYAEMYNISRNPIICKSGIQMIMKIQANIAALLQSTWHEWLNLYVQGLGLLCH